MEKYKVELLKGNRCFSANVEADNVSDAIRQTREKKRFFLKCDEINITWGDGNFLTIRM